MRRWSTQSRTMKSTLRFSAFVIITRETQTRQTFWLGLTRAKCRQEQMPTAAAHCLIQREGEEPGREGYRYVRGAGVLLRSSEVRR